MQVGLLERNAKHVVEIVLKNYLGRVSYCGWGLVVPVITGKTS